MAIITLTTDMGIKDHYVAAVKGSILTQLPDTTIIDVSHNIKPFDIQEAAFVLGSVYKDFPKGTVHLVGVDTESIEKRMYLAAEYNGHFFISADNGVLTLLFGEVPQKVVSINIAQSEEMFSFPAKYIMSEAACFLARGGTMEVLGRPVEEFEKKIQLKPSIDTSLITGHVIYVDAYGNAITNIDKTLFDQVGRGRPFNIFFGNRRDSIRKISKRYCDVPDGSFMGIFTSMGLLQIAINKGVNNYGGSASQLFGLKKTSSIRVEFNDNTNSENGF